MEDTTHTPDAAVPQPTKDPSTSSDSPAPTPGIQKNLSKAPRKLKSNSASLSSISTSKPANVNGGTIAFHQIAQTPTSPSSAPPSSPTPAAPTRHSQIARISSTRGKNRHAPHPVRTSQTVKPNANASSSNYNGIYCGPEEDPSPPVHSSITKLKDSAQSLTGHALQQQPAGTSPKTRSRIASREDDLWMIGGPSPAMSRASSYLGVPGSVGNSSTNSMKTVDIDDGSSGAVGAGTVPGSVTPPMVRASTHGNIAQAPPMTGPINGNKGTKSQNSPNNALPRTGSAGSSSGLAFFGKQLSRLGNSISMSRKKSLGVCTVSSSMSSSSISQISQINPESDVQSTVNQLKDTIGKMRTEQYELMRQLQDEKSARIRMEKEVLSLKERLQALENSNDTLSRSIAIHSRVIPSVYSTLQPSIAEESLQPSSGATSRNHSIVP
ncbi:hypothetical protein BCR33DRAFT_715015 [Rhizoclosmatium globosum]|uniref:Uncharacterized protein n=1 Tax=Rhizoclosmatium globosum TaxID=329046 RepID=A0A1Y2CK76_9FUNG|nr:hypothetical protein BCR33DRAFT_715015 [Rhizoclosmatium globosum]|eukprot:ORY47264.1 hypothetical protein BCR33DRAFT_715015 [Rhizoclosmatium globosum]